MKLSTENGKIITKLYDKRDDFSFFIVRMPNFASDIPSSIFYGSVLSEIRIARASSYFDDFSMKVKTLFQRMINQGGIRKQLLKQLLKAF